MPRILWLPTVKNLEEAFPAKGTELHAVINDFTLADTYTDVQEWVEKCFWKPRLSERVMVALNQIAGTYGDEFCEAQGGRYPSFSYLNTGQTYALTIVRFNDRRIRVASWGDIVENGKFA